MYPRKGRCPEHAHVMSRLTEGHGVCVVRPSPCCCQQIMIIGTGKGGRRETSTSRKVDVKKKESPECCRLSQREGKSLRVCRAAPGGDGIPRAIPAMAEMRLSRSLGLLRSVGVLMKHPI